MKSIRLIVASMSVSLLAAACSVPTGTTEENELAGESEPTAEADQAIGGSGFVRITTYYSNAAHTTEVGYCFFSTCGGIQNSCTGITTSPYVQVQQSSCE